MSWRYLTLLFIRNLKWILSYRLCQTNLNMYTWIITSITLINLIYKKWAGDRVKNFIPYVDGILLIGNNVSILSSFKEWFSSRFYLKNMGDAAHIHGIKLLLDSKKGILGLSQATYFDTLFVRFSIKNSKKVFLPFKQGLIYQRICHPKWLMR